jgi:hypothetical protein
MMPLTMNDKHDPFYRFFFSSVLLLFFMEGQTSISLFVLPFPFLLEDSLEYAMYDQSGLRPISGIIPEIDSLYQTVATTVFASGDMPLSVPHRMPPQFRQITGHICPSVLDKYVPMREQGNSM